ncbi:hypothetical protein PYW07_008685 [Mythimna separata]|uniref:Uncharacterized protein n=1 Tax=Mythimna separata TaxID=271217 RepID=A0AAD7YDJ2_MYTSE|nr:hypothetical protein PYW07_008685 [Mythimna separata]
MKLSVSAYRAHASAHKKILTSSYQQHYGSTAAPPTCNPLQPHNFTPQSYPHLTKLQTKRKDITVRLSIQKSVERGDCTKDRRWGSDDGTIPRNSK